MLRHCIWPAIVIWAATTGGVLAADLKIGDSAPPLSISDWVKGEPFSIGKDNNQVYLVEFWATWCPPCIEMVPHMSELQHKYGKRGLKVVGVTGPGRGETLTKVKRFVRRRGDGMAYAVGFDKSGETHARYMGGVGAAGIPYAFVIDKSGKVVWHGHPGNPEMDEIVDQVIRGVFDVSTAMMQQKLTPLFVRMNRAASIGDWESFKTLTKQILEMDPKNESAVDAAIYAYLMMTDDVAGLRAFVEKHIAANRDNADAMQVLAESLLRIEGLDYRQPDLALRAAAVAYAACNGGDCSKVETYARAVFAIGMVDRAIELQTKAVATSVGAKDKDARKRVLEYYRRCKALQSKKL